MLCITIMRLPLIVNIIVFIFISTILGDNLKDKKLAKKLVKSQFVQQQNTQLNDQTDDLMWFIQISDLHISVFRDKERIQQFKEFTSQTLDIIRPKVVLASGDLTDAKDSNHLGSRQYQEEWKIYKSILISSDVSNKTIWMDIRGNHDNFNVPNTNSTQNYFNKFSMQGRQHQRSYLHQITVGNAKYSFIAVDACLDPGPKKPFNFIGLLDVSETSLIISLAEEARRNGGNYTIWFGHYPTSCILAPEMDNDGLRGIIGQYKESFVYLCGHFHTLGGLLPTMYTMQKPGFLELELGDWKDNRLFRICAFDHGLFSFVDVVHNDWPIVLITNPKNTLFNLPNKESPSLQMDSTHIRILVFTISTVSNCQVQIDSEELRECVQASDNLFVTKWIPEKYSSGNHKINVIIQTQDGRSKTIQQTFSLDGSEASFNLLARFLLMTDVCQVFQALFGLALVLCILPLCVFRIWHELVSAGKCRRPRIQWNFGKMIVRKLWLVSSVDRVFITILIYCLYITMGPWLIGEVIDGYVGWVFVWGMFVNNTYIPGSLTYLYGFFQLFFCQIPLNFIYANAIEQQIKRFSNTTNTRNVRITKYLTHLPFVIIIIMEIVLAYLLWIAYGTTLASIGPFRTWSIILNMILYYLARTTPEKSVRTVIRIWQL